MQTLDINYRKAHEKSASRVKKSIKTIEELNSRNINTNNLEKYIDNKMNILADLDRKYSLEVFRTEKR